MIITLSPHSKGRRAAQKAAPDNMNLSDRILRDDGRYQAAQRLGNSQHDAFSTAEGWNDVKSFLGLWAIIGGLIAVIVLAGASIHGVMI